MSTIQIKGGILQLKEGLTQLSREAPTLLSILVDSDAYMYNSSREPGEYLGGVTAIQEDTFFGSVGQVFGETAGTIYYESAGGSGFSSNCSIYKTISLDLTGINSVSIGYTRNTFVGSNATIFLIAVLQSTYNNDGPYMVPGWPYLPGPDGTTSAYQDILDQYNYMQGTIAARDYENNSSGTLTINTSAMSGTYALLVGVGSDYYNSPGYNAFEIQVTFTSVVTT